jgi:nitrite reductase/ring-hydroxylating ferredoxin subunit/uncharacterized membrane protein
LPQSIIDRVINGQAWLEPVADAIQKVVGGFYEVLGRPGHALKNLLHGTTILGHPLHPALTDVPLGAWTVGVIADWLAIGTSAVPESTGDLALGIGLGGAALSAATGYTDFHETYGHERRIAVSHGLIMTIVVVLEAVSLGLRWGGGPSAHTIAVVLASIGLALVLAGAYLGGHLTFGLGTMVNRTAFLEMPEDFVAVGPAAEFVEGKMTCVKAGNLAVLVTRLNGDLFAIANTCSHAGGPLNEGALEGDSVICPWHGSRFSVRDGRVTGGPATFHQPELLVREHDGMVEVRPAVAPH